MKTYSFNTLLYFLIVFCVEILPAQDLTISRVNSIDYPAHRDNIGQWAVGDTLFVNGTYSKQTATSVEMRLLTFARGTWTNPIDNETVIIDQTVPFSGIIDNYLVIPEDYTLYVANDPGANTQMLQVRAFFSDGPSKLFNFFLSVVQDTPGQVIDFDAVYGTASGTTLKNNIELAISNASVNDTILFKSPEYDFQGTSFTIGKGVTLSGILPDTIDTSTKGAYDVETTFKNLKNLNMSSSFINIRNLKIVADASTGYVFTRFRHPSYTTGVNIGHRYNIHITNVIYEEGGVQVYGENGAGVTFENVSFLEYSNGGYYTNRKDPIDSCPKVVVRNCRFKPKASAINYNVRGMSIDAGNDEHPMVWDQNETLVEGCLFDGTGVGWSKGKNVIIRNNHFLGYRTDVDMIHMEEYTSFIHIENNTFEFISPSRCMFIDREAQPSHDITIINNTFKGTYHWVFWCYSPYNILIENNDFTQANANNTGYKTFDFNAFHSTEPYPYEAPIENVIIRNNSGLTNVGHGIFSYYYLKNDTSNILEYASNKIEKTELDERPKPIIDTTQIFKIRNKNSGEVMVAQNGDSKIGLTSSTITDESDLWIVKFRYPYTYTFLNKKTNQFLEVETGFTLPELTTPPSTPIYAEQISDYSQKQFQPHFFLRTVENGSETNYQLAPGGNEKKTRLVKEGALVRVEGAQVSGTLFPATNESTWELVPSGTLSIKKAAIEKVQIFPNPASDTITIKSNNQDSRFNEVALYNILGKEVYHAPLQTGWHSHNIPVTHISKGLYLVKLKSNTTSKTSKLIIK